jgi:hypothetical protein
MVPFFILSKKGLKHEEKGCLPKSASFKVIELDFLTYLLFVADPWPFMQEEKVPMQFYFTSHLVLDH